MHRTELRTARFALLAPLLLAACSGAQVGHGGEDMRPVDEARAIAVIEDALAAQRLGLAKGGEVAFADGKVGVEVWIEGDKYGVAYITELEDQKSGGKLPKSRGPVLPLLQVEGDRTVLVLYEHDYRYDAGKTHATTSVTAELKLKRDVTDFAVQVVKK